MPTYEFRCPTGHDFEVFYRSISAAPTEVLCPACGRVAARQLSAGGGLLFKGSGFYITDYGKDGKKSQAAVTAAGEGSTDKAAGDPSTSKSDSSAAADKGSGAGSDGGIGASKPAAESKPASREQSSDARSSKPTSPKKPKASE